jgi:hypothetical protein
MELIEAQIPFVLHDAVREFKSWYTTEGEKYQYAKDDIKDAENKYNPGCRK